VTIRVATQCRYLLVVIAPALDGGVYIVAARNLTDSERRTFRR